MTFKQLKFVKEYVRNGGNGVQAALAVYSTKSYNTANQIALANLQSPTVIAEIRGKLEKLGLTDGFLDKSLYQIIQSGLENSKNTTPADALTAIQEVNKLKARFTPEKRIVTNLNLQR